MPVALTIAQVVEKVLTRFDANSDASISLTELLSVLDPTGTGLDVATKAAALLAEVGGNSDDDVLQKLLHGRSLHGDRTAPTPQSVETIVDGLLTKFDANADQSITLTELLGGLNADDRLHADLTTLLTQIVADLDNNGDGGLSTVELTTAVDALDLNQNGLVDFAEAGPAATGNANVELVGLPMHHGHDLPDDAV